MSTPPTEECPHQPECLRDVHAIRTAVFGNGHPEHSLLVRMQHVERRLSAIQKLSLATVCGVWALVVRFVGVWLESFFEGGV